MDDSVGHWFAGFVAGEGCFQILPSRSSGGWTRYRLHFSLALRDDDAEILYVIRDETGIGDVRHSLARGTRDGDVATWVVTRQSDVLALCRVLDRYPIRARKQIDYEIWREAAHVWTRVRRDAQIQGDWAIANRAVWDRMGELRSLLLDARAYETSAAVA